MEQYELIIDPLTGNVNVYVRRLSDNSLIHTKNNQEYLKWLEEGNLPLDPRETINNQNS